MKHSTALPNRFRQQSHPAWVCGLKLAEMESIRFQVKVTPCVGVWIETKNPTDARDLGLVTPCVGVWIETDGAGAGSEDGAVTPCVGVWIETT